MNGRPKYSVVIAWSEPDQEYVADVPDLGAFSALGPTPEEALREVLFALDGFREAVEAQGGALPQPKERVVGARVA